MFYPYQKLAPTSMRSTGKSIAAVLSAAKPCGHSIPVPIQFLGPAPKGMYAPLGPMPDRGLAPPPALVLCLGTLPGVMASLAPLVLSSIARALFVLVAANAGDAVELASCSW